jgi:hypothetical protein
MLVDANVAMFEGLGVKIAIPPKTFPATNIPSVPKNPVAQQLADRKAPYTALFPQGFPTHEPPKQAE